MKRFLVIILIVVLAIFLRFYQLGNVPSGLTNDEADIGYDAYSILLTGRDQWNSYLPITGFKGFGDYRPVLYTYLVIPSIASFGITPFGVRFPSAFFGVLSVIVLYLLAKKLFDKKIGLVAAFLFAISPWAIGMNRIGVESSVAIFFLMIGLLFFTYSKKSFVYLFAGVFSIALTLYLYTAYALFAPLLLLSLTIYFRKSLFKNKKLFIFSLLFFFLLLTPYFFSLKNSGVFSRASTEGIFINTESIGVIHNINAKRGSCWEYFNDNVCRLLANKPVEFTEIFLKNLINHFSFNFLFLNGTDVLRTILPEMGHQHLIELFFFVFGLYFLVSTKNKYTTLLIALLILSAVPDSLTGPGNFSRSSMMQPFLFLIEAFGLVGLVNLIIKKYRFKSSIVWGFLTLVILITTFRFFINYLTYFKTKFSTKHAFKELSKDLAVEKNNYEKIYVSEYGADAELHVFYLFYRKYDPRPYQTKTMVSYSYKNNWVSIDRLENVYFVDRLPIDQKGRVLFIAKPDVFPENAPFKKQIKDLSGNIVFLEVNSQDLINFTNELCHYDEACVLKSGWFQLQ